MQTCIWIQKHIVKCPDCKFTIDCYPKRYPYSLQPAEKGVFFSSHYRHVLFACVRTTGGFVLIIPQSSNSNYSTILIKMGIKIISQVLQPLKSPWTLWLPDTYSQMTTGLVTRVLFSPPLHTPLLMRGCVCAPWTPSVTLGERFGDDLARNRSIIRHSQSSFFLLNSTQTLKAVILIITNICGTAVCNLCVPVLARDRKFISPTLLSSI